MEQVFQKFQKAGKNTVDELIKWMKDAKVIDATKDAEGKVRQLFGNENKDNVSLEKFKEVVQKLATDQKKNLEEINKNLISQGNKAVDMLKAGASALKDKFMK
ncbi:unnamed protein product [Diatraea saccharalis]|uniref:Uncharacterized protein n=1 Tax=Diatraea saccharalis TaxID=40085 RepID=A0A9N9WFR1_9NEOP|nr:unnamed protein product [Diatraea saccharalis]